MLDLRQHRSPPMGVSQPGGRGVQAARPDAGRRQRAIPARHRPRPRELPSLKYTCNPRSSRWLSTADLSSATFRFSLTHTAIMACTRLRLLSVLWMLDSHVDFMMTKMLL